MIIVQGASVLSHFKAQKLLHRMQKQGLPLTAVHAEQVYFIYGPKQLSQSAQLRLEELLSGRVTTSLSFARFSSFSSSSLRNDLAMVVGSNRHM